MSEPDTLTYQRRRLPRCGIELAEGVLSLHRRSSLEDLVACGEDCYVGDGCNLSPGGSFVATPHWITWRSHRDCHSPHPTRRANDRNAASTAPLRFARMVSSQKVFRISGNRPLVYSLEIALKTLGSDSLPANLANFCPLCGHLALVRLLKGRGRQTSDQA